jgi:hypothetical protein
MGNPMRIRANATGDVVEVKVLMRHDMETGQRKDASGKAVPAITWNDNTGDSRTDEAAVS